MDGRAMKAWNGSREGFCFHTIEILDNGLQRRRDDGQTLDWAEYLLFAAWDGTLGHIGTLAISPFLDLGHTANSTPPAGGQHEAMTRERARGAKNGERRHRGASSATSWRARQPKGFVTGRDCIISHARGVSFLDFSFFSFGFVSIIDHHGHLGMSDLGGRLSVVSRARLLSSPDSYSWVPRV